MLDHFFEFIYVYIFSHRKIKSLVNAIILFILPARIKRKGVFINLNKSDPVISGALLLGVFENKEIKTLSALFRPGQVFLDIGANIGIYSAIAGAKLGKNGKVFSFEPHPPTYNILLKTIQSNKLNNIYPVKAAASYKNGVTKLYASEFNGGDNRMYITHDLEKFDTYKVKTLNLSNYLLKQGVKKVDLIKIDVQGYEYYVFLGLCKLIKKSDNCKILTEFWPEGIIKSGVNPIEFLNFIHLLGFKIQDIKNNKYIYKNQYKWFINEYPNRKYTNLLLSKNT